MPTQRFATTLAAGAINANIIAGSQFEFLGAITRVQIYQLGDIGVGLYNSEVFFGQVLELADSPGPLGTVGTGPRVPDDLILDAIGAPGDRLVIRMTETGGAAIADVRTLVVLTPV